MGVEAGRKSDVVDGGYGVGVVDGVASICCGGVVSFGVFCHFFGAPSPICALYGILFCGAPCGVVCGATFCAGISSSCAICDVFCGNFRSAVLGASGRAGGVVCGYGRLKFSNNNNNNNYSNKNDYVYTRSFVREVTGSSCRTRSVQSWP